MSVLEASGLHVSAGGAALLRGVDCAVQAGRVTGLIGPNGAGKSTLLRALLRLQRLDAGRVLWQGEDITAQPPHRLSHVFAYLAQSQTVHWPLTVEALVTLGRRPAFTAFARLTPADRAAIDTAIRRTGLTGQRQRPIASLSGGERARALLARVLAADAPIVLADEPVAALDPYHQLNILELLKEMAANGRAVLIVLHDLGLARRYCDDVIVLNDGQTVAMGPAGHVLTPAILQPVYRVALDFSASGAVLPLARTR